MAQLTRRSIALLAVAVVCVVAVVVGGRVLWERTHRSTLEQALEAVPAASLRVSFTDWAAVRRAVGVSATTKAAGIQRLVDKAYDVDLSGASSIDESGPALQKYFGFSPGNAEWEAYAQSRQGAAMVLRLPDDVSADDVRGRLASAGFKRPASDGGVWRGGADLVSTLDPSISPELQYVVVLDHLVVSSDSASYAAKAAAVASGDGAALAGVDGVDTLSGGVEQPASATVWSRDFACEDLAMSQADDEDQQRARQLVARAGKITPLSGLMMAMDADRTLHVVEAFEDADQARENLRARARLAVGEAVGRGGDFADRFRLTQSATSGSAVVLTLEPKEKSGFVLSDLDSGPVLFATC